MNRIVTFVAFALSAAAVFASKSAAATTISVYQEESLPRTKAVGGEIAKRPPTLTPEGINRQDCEEDQAIRFPLQLSDFQANASFEMWASVAGSDCSSAPSRSGAAAVCWRLGTAPLATSTNIDIPVRTLLSGARLAPAGGVPTSTGDCGTVDRTQIAVHFLYFEPGQAATPSVTKSVTIPVDTVGPRPVGGVSVAGDGTVRWETSDEQVTTNVYCADIPGDDDAGPTCTFASFEPPGALPSRDLAQSYLCGSLAGSADTSFRLQGTSSAGFREGGRYAFALSSLDTFGNASPLSATTCAVIDEPAVPASQSNGDDGESGCSASGRAGAPLTSLGLGLVVALVAGVFSRRHRSSR